MYPVHESPTGSFQELAREKDVKFGQLSYLTIKPKCSRGNHYHKWKEEWFCCIRGKCEMHLTDIRNNKDKKIILDSSKKEFIKINPFENHVVTNLSENEDCELLVIISEEYYQEDADTFKPDES
jgi:UDP-2-acetamido-2,6-beta-L-arabino-hexul-4-ose reductase